MGRGASVTGGIKRKKILILKAGHLLLVWKKGIVAMREHDPREVPHEWFCLNVEVPGHRIAAPAANQVNDVAVNS